MKSFRRLFRYQRAGYLFVLPGFLYMLVFVGWPMLYNVILSLQDVTQKNLINGERQFVALANYADLFADSVFRRSIGNTLLYTVLCLVLQFAVGFLLALFFSRNFSFAKPIRGLLMMPWMIPVTVTALMFKFIFGTDVGILNYILKSFGLIGSNIDWLTSPVTAMLALVVANVWIGIPFNMILLSTGLTTIPTELYESAAIERSYAAVTGTVPMMPEYGLGFWQCKLRYQTQEELLSIAREYKRRGLPLDVIVVDFFHWPRQGEWKIDPTYWPDPAAMLRELHAMGVELMVSVWPTVEPASENYPEMLEKGYLIRVERGHRTGLDFQGSTIHIDATNPQARAYLWGKLRDNYYRYGVRLFWLDEAEPEYARYDFDNYRYWLGTDLEVGNCYPSLYSRAVFEGQQAEGQTQAVNLVRCAWAGSQNYGALVWSGDIASSFTSMRNQLAAGLNMGLAGIPWWNSDIGGFHGGDPADPAFRELFARWFEWGAFCPVMRTLFYEFPEDPTCWQVEDEYLYGPDYLVAPVLTAGQRTRRVYLPAGADWIHLETGETQKGGQWLDVPCPLDSMPVFVRT